MQTKSYFQTLVIFFFVAVSAPLFAQNSISQQNFIKPNEEVASMELRYYYYPNLRAYFDLKSKLYIYKLNGEWQSDQNLPEGYGGYSLFNKNYVIIRDYNGDEIIQFINLHKKKYPYNSKGRIIEEVVKK